MNYIKNQRENKMHIGEAIDKELITLIVQFAPLVPPATRAQQYHSSHQERKFVASLAVYAVDKLLVLGSYKIASDKFFVILSKALLATIICRKKITHPTGDRASSYRTPPLRK